MGTSVTISTAVDGDAEQILKLQYLCYQPEAALYDDYNLEPLTQTLDDLRAELRRGIALVARLGSEIVGAVRGEVDGDGTAKLAKLIVHPRMQGHGIGIRLMSGIEERLANGDGAASSYQLFTGHRSEANLRLYKRLGYTPVSTQRVNAKLSLITLEKPAPGRAPASAAATATTGR
ncbi:GNAT family N-acetyltransferase [Streptomyces sp. A7024]|uniref:GNAT family N-acetyltransferase n=1 Tax=Streptomyces coryli TaxID=1128680 RepID=A0A6G4U1K4_9ACTN|nr:GNAT family N-acetyltransferase [Streptomyces coryli]NGN65586.1 GNAT family N-acetyltransferase [Streptomyces coryli]